ncbi:unnamed protein product [Mytilus coruscus]|uniref:Uncharacterized protein n=1 Tax=Mytilus coruscus TaxID=42192 RepID=A0A6J8BFZ2_MYTCO|nr:unnamed protein product [Mytilus coruscus]
MNTRTCQTVEDPSTYSVVELNCLYEGKGRYLFEGPSSIRRVTIDRLTEESIIIILGDLHEFFVLTGKPDLCSLISVPKSTIVKIGSAYCSPLAVSTDVYVTQTPDQTQTLQTPHPVQATSQEMMSHIVTSNDRTFKTPHQVQATSQEVVSHIVTSNDKTTQTTHQAQVTSQKVAEHTVVWEKQTNQASGEETDTGIDSTPWIVTTAIVLAENLQLVILSAIGVLYAVRRYWILHDRNLQNLILILQNIQAVIRLSPLPQPAPLNQPQLNAEEPIIPLNQPQLNAEEPVIIPNQPHLNVDEPVIPLRRSQRIKKPVQRLTM